MTNRNLYSPLVWDKFVAKFRGSKARSYRHFDTPRPFDDFEEKLFEYVSDVTLKKVSEHAFLPFIKINTKTQRYRYQESEKCYGYELQTKIRPIAFSSHFDTLVYAFYAFALNERYQNHISNMGFSESVLAYRTDLDGKCNIQFAKEVFDQTRWLSKKHQKITAIALDISGYFDSILHKRLKERWCQVLEIDQLPIDQYNVFKSLSRYSYSVKSSLLKHFGVKAKTKVFNYVDIIPKSLAGPSFSDKFSYLRNKNLIALNKPKQKEDESGVKHAIGKGIPQGSAMSAVLSNIYLIDFDKHMFNLSSLMKFVYRRYCDDILIICESEKADFVYEKVLINIKDEGLEIQEKKRDVVEFKRDSFGKLRAFNGLPIKKKGKPIKPKGSILKNLQYLGFEFNGETVYIRPSSLSRYFMKAKGGITRAVLQSLGNNSISEQVFKKKLYERYTHLGRQNFISYALRAASKSYKNSKGFIQEGFDSKSIKRQIRAHFDILAREIENTRAQILADKIKKSDGSSHS